MNRRFVSTTVIGLLLLGSAADAQQVYVRNRPFKGTVSTVAGEVWVDLKALAEAFEIKPQQTESGGWVVARDAPTAEALAQVTAGQVLVAGKPVESQAGEGGALLVPLKSTSELLGARVTPNKQLGTIDVVLAPAARAAGGASGMPGAGPGMRSVNTPGAAVELTQKLSPGITNIAWFTAPWCGPCQAMRPGLEALAASKKNVAVLKVEIGKWGTPVANQYQIKSIPYFHVYDASGKKIAEGKAARQMVERMMR